MTTPDYTRFVLHLTHDLMCCDHVVDVYNFIVDLWARLGMGYPPGVGDGLNYNAIAQLLGGDGGIDSEDFAALLEPAPDTPASKADTRVDVEHGKYTFVVHAEDGRISISRYGSPWIDRVREGSKALIALVHEASTPRHERNLTFAEARSLIGCTILIQRGSVQELSTCLVVDDGDGEWPLLQRAEDHRHSYGRKAVGAPWGRLGPHVCSYIVVSRPTLSTE